ncbi:unnamed protein product [Acanthoscelides obtectus]|uniref:Uncharacterized protein n=1 Tax=Acanthoscelides obtectus TaxID=200917 RepID=A0A9P0KB06_ACAOB|nr:unnamed protein product [Acanthoscelides obtectus]CAK1666929.1 hypothetical protein AOBTE_LOCUS25558 [Acanthoscelides obtectus]
MLFVALAQRSRLQPDQPLADKVIAAVSRCGSAPLAFGVIAGGTDGYFRETESPNYRRTNEPASCLTQLHATRDARRLAASRRRAVDRRRRNSRGFGVDCVCGAFAASTSSMRRTQSWLALAAQYVRLETAQKINMGLSDNDVEKIKGIFTDRFLQTFAERVAQLRERKYETRMREQEQAIVELKEEIRDLRDTQDRILRTVDDQEQASRNFNEYDRRLQRLDLVVPNT